MYNHSILLDPHSHQIPGQHIQSIILGSLELKHIIGYHQHNVHTNSKLKDDQ